MADALQTELDDLSLAALRERRSEKWTRYPADVHPAAVAEMDFPLASPIRERLHAAIDNGDCGYASPDQTELAETYAAYASAHLGWVVDPAGVVPVTDVMVGVAEVLRLATRPGDGVVICPPVYPPFFSTIREVGRTVVEVPLQVEGGRYAHDLDELERAFAAGARAYLLCNPHNPVGRVWSPGELRAVAELAERHGVVVVADEVHAPLALGDARHQPWLALGGYAADHGTVITAASKTWNFAGLKCAVMITEPGTMRETLRGLPADLLDRVGHLGVLASIAAWRDGEPWRQALRSALERNRALVGELLAEHLPDVSYRPPEASYLAWLNCRELGLGDDPAAVFLERGRVGLYPGLRFGSPGAGFVRLNFGTSAALVALIVERMEDAVRPSNDTTLT